MTNKKKNFLPLTLIVVLVITLIAGIGGVALYADEYLPNTEPPIMSDLPDNGEEDNGNGGNADGEEDNGNGGDVDGEEDSGNGGNVDGEDVEERIEDNIILIRTGQELYDLANALNSGLFSETYGAGVSDANVTLANDIDLSGFQSGGGFVPIGNEDHQFKGEFDGAGFTISNLSINREGSNFQGLFGVIGEGGNVHNVNLAGANIKACMFVGGIAGLVEYGTISNCTVNGNVEASVCAAGGIAGVAVNSLIDACKTSGTVTADSEGAGGIAGLIMLENCVVRNCSSSALITVTFAAGGIVGALLDGDVQGCSFSGELICKSKLYGSIVGEINRVEMSNADVDGMFERLTSEDTGVSEYE